MTLASGTKLGPFQIQSPLGAGGMGEVYRALDTRLDRTVAIKVLASHLSSSPELKQRMEREARSISALNHPNICHLYDIGSQDGTDYLVMEFLEGETLAERLRKGAMPLNEVFKVGIAVAEALAVAHRQGIVHRDLKPGNIMLTPGGAKLMDFGLAKPLGLQSSGGSGAAPSFTAAATLSGPSPLSPLTTAGSIIGTIQYMAPEQIEGKEADARSDIFAFGAVLYEMLTGRRPFAGKSQISLASSILEKDPEPISATHPLTPPAFEHVLNTCLRKNPEERFQSAYDIKLELQWIAAADRSFPAMAALPPSPSHSRGRLGWAAAAVATLAALGLAALHFFAAPPVGQVVHSSILPPTGGAFIMMAVESGPPVLSPDGTRLAFTARDEKGKVMLFVRPLNSQTALALTGTDEAMYPFWSADSREIGFFASSKLRRIDAAGGPPQTVCDAANGRGGSWGKDGVIVFTATTSSPLLRVPASGGTPEPASKLDTSQGENSHRWPFFLPDGKHFLFWARTSQGVQGNALYVGELGSLQAKQLMKSETMAEYASGYLLFMREQTVMARPFNARTLEVSGEAVPVAEHVAINGGVSRPIFSTSQNGMIVYESGETAGTWNLEWVARDGKPLGAVAPPDRYFYPALSPDGTRIAVNLFNGTQGTQDIWIFDLVRGTRTRLTFGGASQVSAAWSPDGKTIFYQSNAKGGYHIYSRAADGSGLEQIVIDSKDVEQGVPICSPDGRYIVYLTRSGSQPSTELWTMPLFGDRKPFPIVQSTFVKGGAAVSPDGNWLAYHTSESGRNEVYVIAFPGGGAKWQVSTNGGIGAHWRKDGKELFFLDPTDNIVAVDVNTASHVPQLGVPHKLFQANGIQRQSGPFDVTGDGKKFLVNTGNTKDGSDPLTLVLNWPAELKKQP